MTNTSDEPLGTKHKVFNKKVQDAISGNSQLEEKVFTKTSNDLDNLMKIDIASHNKDVDYILSVLKSDDMLYVSRAIKQCPWLVEDQYDNIINPTFLNEQLFPLMKTKASIKLLKHIRHYLKNESRVEEFYKNETNSKAAAAKWLSRCSIPFIEENISKHMHHITDLEFKRICVRSFTVFEAAMKDYHDSRKLIAASFFLHTHTDKYLDMFEAINRFSRPTFSPTATKLIMKKSPERITIRFLQYVSHIHIPTFIDNIKREQIKDFLFELANGDDEMINHCYHIIFDYKIIKQFVERMPKEEQFEFVKKVFMDKENLKVEENETLQRGTEKYAMKKICGQVWSRKPLYHFYEFAPFDVAFQEIKKLIENEANINEKYSMFKVLLICAAKNTKNLLEILLYYSKNSSNDDTHRKTTFISKFITESGIYKRGQESWKAFTDILKSIKDINVEDYAEITIIYNILHNAEISELIKNNKFWFVSLHSYRNNLNQEEQSKVFEYIYNYVLQKVQDQNIQTSDEFVESINNVDHLLNILLYWDKELTDYPLVLEKVKDLVRLSKDNSWEQNMSYFYKKKQSWRRLMFEESIILDASQNVFVNALKHDPTLLIRYNKNVEPLCYNDKISLKRLLKKMRIYWPDSLAATWGKSYLDRLETADGYKALTKGLCTILPQEQLLDVVKKYAPAQPKVDWNNTNEVILGLQRHFAKNMHIARPQPSADTILLYAKGDFLQYSLPSVHAIYYNMGRLESQEHIPKLLNSPVSLQKHGLRFAFIKLKHEELKLHLCNIWQASKNVSIRAVTFVLLFELLCKEKDAGKIEELWEILQVFMDNLTFKEDKKIYEKLGKVNDVPDSVKPRFLIKSYKFLQNLLPHIKIDKNKYEYMIKQLADYTRNIMESMNPEFVENIITEHLDANFCKYEGLNDSMLYVTSCYLLCAKEEAIQNNKYEKILSPLIKRALNQWNDMHESKYFVRKNFENLLQYLYRDLEKYVVENKMIVPIKMFQNIQKELETLPVPYNYVFLRAWKLIVKITELIEKIGINEEWQEICSKMVPELGTFCLEILKDDSKTYFTCIYVLFEKVMNMSIRDILPEIVRLKIYEILLGDPEFIPAYLLMIRIMPNHGRNYYYDENNECNIKEKEIIQLIQSNASVEVKMHYYCKYEDDTENVIGF